MEMWDEYDINRVKTGKTRMRGEGRGDGVYQMVIHAAIFNPEGKMLIQRRQKTAHSWPDLWDVSCGGHVISGEDCRQAATRELKEELGLDVDLEGVLPNFSFTWNGGFDEYFLLEMDVDIKSISLQESEVQDVAWATREEIHEMIRDGRFITYYEHLIDLMFDMRGKYGVHSNIDNKYRK